MIAFKILKTIIFCFLYLLRSVFTNLLTGQFKEFFGKHPISRCRIIKCITYIKKDSLFIFQ